MYDKGNRGQTTDGRFLLLTSDFWFHHLKFYGRNIKALRSFYYSDVAPFVVLFFYQTMADTNHHLKLESGGCLSQNNR